MTIVVNRLWFITMRFLPMTMTITIVVNRLRLLWLIVYAHNTITMLYTELAFCWISYLECDLLSLFLFAIMYTKIIGSIILVFGSLLHAYSFMSILMIILYSLFSFISWEFRKLVKSWYTYVINAGLFGYNLKSILFDII